MGLSSAGARALAGLAVLVILPARSPAWDAIPDEQLKGTTPRVSPTSDAEALWWEIRAEDSFASLEVGTEIHHHLRIRVYTPRGKDTMGRVDLPFGGGVRIRNVQARTVLPDGQAIAVKGNEIFERTIVKARGQKIQAMSFTFPAVEVGCILEYRWTEARYGGGLNTMIFLQRDVPVQRLSCRLRPILLPDGPSFRYSLHRAPMGTFTRDPDRYYSASVTNVPAFREEPHMPPAVEVMPWVAMHYVNGRETAPQFWTRVSIWHSERDRLALSGTREIKDLARTLTASAGSDDEKLAALYDFCSRQILNLSHASVSRRLRTQWPKNVNEALSRREGSSLDIERLFASLARSLGFDARVAHLANRELTFFEEASMVEALLSTSNVAVRSGNAWRFFDPGSPAVPFGALRWQEEGQRVLIPDGKELIWAETPRSPAPASRVRRLGRFDLAEDGTLEGDVACEYTGHLAREQKATFAELDGPAREAEVVKQVRARLPLAELSGISFQNVEGVDHPVTIRYHLTVPGYADATGKRRFFQPALFQKGAGVVFSEESRIHPIDFRHAWSEYDSVLLRIPEGFEFDHPEAPTDQELGDVGAYQVRLGLAQGGRMLLFRREFWWDHTRFEPSQYRGVRNAFTAVRERDDHTLAIRRSSAGGE